MIVIETNTVIEFHGDRVDEVWDYLGNEHPAGAKVFGYIAVDESGLDLN